MNRCKHDIINDVLNALVARSRRITELCSIGNVPVDRGKDIILSLERFGLLVELEKDGQREFTLTDRGYEWLGLYKHLVKILP